MEQHDNESLLIYRLEEMEDQLVAAGICEPGHDDWDGAAGVEIRQFAEEGMYMPYPHHWDFSLGWCRVTWSMKLYDVGAQEYPLPSRDKIDIPYNEAEDIPPQIFARAIGKGWRY